VIGRGLPREYVEVAQAKAAAINAAHDAVVRERRARLSPWAFSRVHAGVRPLTPEPVDLTFVRQGTCLARSGARGW
jgi:hypothetical protein